MTRYALIIAAVALSLPNIASADDHLSYNSYGSWASAKFEASDGKKANSERAERAPTNAHATYQGPATGSLQIRTGQGANDETTTSADGKIKISTNFTTDFRARVSDLTANGVQFSKVNSKLPDSMSYGGPGEVGTNVSNSKGFIIFGARTQPDPRAPTGDCRTGCEVRGTFSGEKVSGTWSAVVNRNPVNGPTPTDPIMHFGGTYTAHR